MKHSLLSIGFLFLFLAGCDEFSAPDDSSSASLESLTITPNSIEFDDTAPIKDSTLTVDLQLTLREAIDADYKYTVQVEDTLLKSGEFQQQPATDLSASFSLDISTTDFTNYTVYAFAGDDYSGERIQGGITIRGRFVAQPQLVDAFNTEAVTIPESGRERVDFYARVVHPTNQQYINRVSFILEDQEGDQVGNDFDMFDNGVFSESSGRIDEVAEDSLYSRAFFVEPTNNPDLYTVSYYAIGIDGKSSDTLQTQLRIQF